MTHEKIVVLPSGRPVVIIITRFWSKNLVPSQDEARVQIKGPKDKDFHTVIQRSHPKCHKIKQLDRANANAMHLRYSGFFAKHIRKAFAEFEHVLTDQLVFNESN